MGERCRWTAGRLPAVGLAAGLGLALVLTLLIGVGRASALDFTPPHQLPASPPKGSMDGGEPSAVFDPDGRHFYVTAPAGIPAGLAGKNGVNFWASSDGGRTFPLHKNVGSSLGGGDSDVAVGIDHTLFVADLEAAASAVCRSKDHGKTFLSACSGIPVNQAGPDDDREWLTPDTRNKNVVYLTYHDLAAELPEIYKSTTQGSPGSFVECGSLLQPGSQAASNYSTGGTDVGKPAIDRQGDLYVPITEPDAGGSPTAGYDGFYVAVGARGCPSVFKDYTIYHHKGASLANIFSDLAVDRAGTVYALAAGTLTGSQKTYGIYLFVSRTHGRTWSKPIRINSRRLRANVLPALAGGLGSGQAVIGWYGTSTSGDPNNTKDQWRYYVDTTFDYGKHLQRTTITPRVFHYGDICTQGILCGSTPGGPSNRNLLDFSSVGVNPSTGCTVAVLPGDPYDTPGKEAATPSAAYVARQTSGRCLNVKPRRRRPPPRRPHHGPRFTG